MTIYTKELAEKICERIATSTDGIKTICKDDGMPDASTFRGWVFRHEEVREMYNVAKAMQAELLAEESLEIADDGSRDYKVDKDGNEVVNYDNIARARLRVDTRKWHASKLLPKKYGDSMTHKGDEQAPLIQVITGVPDAVPRRKTIEHQPATVQDAES